eukprot:XP_008660652.2 uncharacterized protein LOC103639698 [Zea mays]
MKLTTAPAPGNPAPASARPHAGNRKSFREPPYHPLPRRNPTATAANRPTSRRNPASFSCYSSNLRERTSGTVSGPYYWVKCKPADEPIPVSQPNQGSVRGRKEKKRIKQRKDFIMAEKKKRRALYSAAVKRKEAERTERKMAAVARERAWAARLIELKQLEEEIKAVMA